MQPNNSRKIHRIRFMYKNILIVIFLLPLFAVPTFAESEQYVQTATDIDGTAKCNEVRDYVITRSSGPCKSVEMPRMLHVGSEVMVNKRAKIIKFIQANLVTKDMPGLGLKQGQWTCVAVESKNHLPENDNTGWWIYIPNCQPEGKVNE